MHTKRLYGIRGAVCTENNPDELRHAVCALIREIFEKNAIEEEEDIVSLQFTLTQDLDCLNPAAALRQDGLCTHTALFCSAEPQISGSMPKTIRVLITAYCSGKPVHVYAGEAQKLRPDLAKTGSGRQ
ncbi:chorismate mutase [Treponema sp. OMZ 840]|uniref:chorismate mutase n=1 Tax=Treponema sp. OMZ 840 TaxID=244313 RepID=UPI003D949041